MMTQLPHIDLRAMIDAYRAKTGMAATAFGIDAVGDPSLISDLDNGRELRRATVARVLEYMTTGKTHAEARAEARGS